MAGVVTGYISRLFLFQTAYEIEFDLRNIIYEHLTRDVVPVLRPGPVGPAHLAGPTPTSARCRCT